MIRTFNSVGHGGFYTEEFDGFTMIFDCGGRNVPIINHEIDHSLRKNQIINALFISHFHRDHINGLEHLLGNYKVEKVFLPLLSSNCKIKLLIENAILGDNDIFTSELISDSQSTIQNYSRIGTETKVISVEYYNENNSAQNNENTDIESINSNIASGTVITFGNSGKEDEWVYIPFNFEFSNYANALIAKLICLNIPIDNMLRELRTDRKRIIGVYKEVLGSKDHFNSNSLTLYSGLRKNNLDRYLRFNYSHFLYPFHRTSHSVGCLYLGDYSAKDNGPMKELESVYTNYWDLIGTIQIPHHGSFYNYNDKLNKKKGLISVMSTNSNGKHPHALTVKSIVVNYGFPVIVTEQPSSRFIERILP